MKKVAGTKKATKKPNKTAKTASLKKAKNLPPTLKLPPTPRLLRASRRAGQKPLVPLVIETPVPEEERPSRYYAAVGRRKRAVARVRLFTRGEKEFLVNSKPYTQYFGAEELQLIADAALRRMKVTDKFRVFVRVFGGGLAGQAEAVRHGISRALIKFNPDFRKRLKRVGYLSRDPREKERRKFGLKKARKAPQWAKR